MPIYQYECKNPECKIEFEERHTIADYEKDQVCPKCKGPAKRVLRWGRRYGPNVGQVEAPLLLFNWVSPQDGG